MIGERGPALSLYLLKHRAPAEAEDGSCLVAVVAALDVEHAKTMATAKHAEAGTPSAGGIPRLWFNKGAQTRLLASATYATVAGVICAQHKGLL